jgi:hypothetical protein
MAATNGTFGQQDQYRASTEHYPATSGATEASGANSDLSKDEIGWYFVEQYYTTLSKSPEKLHVRYTISIYLFALTFDSCSTANGLNSSLVPRLRSLLFLSDEV